jgi:hypothetical protein
MMMEDITNSANEKPDSSMMNYVADSPEYNTQVEWVIVPIYPPNDYRHDKPTIEGNPGKYKVTFTLSVPGKNVFRNHINLSNEKGDSLLGFPPDILTREILVTDQSHKSVSIILSTNDDHRLSTVTMTIKATSLVEAERICYETISHLLSYLSYSNDVAIDTAGYNIIEEDLGTIKGVWGMIGKVKMLSINEESGQFTIDDDFKRIFAAYREGMNATNVFYQALSFSKVIEGCTKLREHKNKVPKSTGGKSNKQSLRMPKQIQEFRLSDTFISQSITPFLGQKYTTITEHFRPLIRNAIAHLDPSQDVLDIDHLEDISKCKKAIPVLRYMARTLIKFERDNK